MGYFKKFIQRLFVSKKFFLKASTFEAYCNNCRRLNKKLFNYLKYPELVKLSKSENVYEHLKYKVKRILNNPIIDNSIQPKYNVKLQNNSKIDKFIRIASWNINRSFNTNNLKMVFSNSDSYLAGLKTKNSKTIKKVREQIEMLKHSDIIVLNEVDAGMPRSDYKKVVEELGKTIGYNYAYGIEFLEIDPVQLGLDNYKWSEKKELLRLGLIKNSVLDKDKYRGLHGNAILSRFPLENVRIVRLFQPYDWYNSEKKEPTILETIRRYIFKYVFKEDVVREIRIGGRIALIADVKVPEVNLPITIVSTHLENKASPKDRNQQIKDILENIKNINNPIILAGDLNTNCHDSSPIKSDSFLTIMSMFIKSICEIPNSFRRYSDPTVRNIPLILPNQEEKLFATLKEAEFSNCESFDFSGKKELSFNGKKGNLSDSNERSVKGFKPTFVFERSFGIAKYKLDWIFVKSCFDSQSDRKIKYELTPFYGRTLYELNYAQKGQLSDHAPITVDISFQPEK